MGGQELPFLFAKLGRWWHKDKEIDLVALKEEGYLCYDLEDIRKFTDILDIF